MFNWLFKEKDEYQMYSVSVADSLIVYDSNPSYRKLFYKIKDKKILNARIPAIVDLHSLNINSNYNSYKIIINDFLYICDIYDRWRAINLNYNKSSNKIIEKFNLYDIVFNEENSTLDEKELLVLAAEKTPIKEIKELQSKVVLIEHLNNGNNKIYYYDGNEKKNKILNGNINFDESLTKVIHFHQEEKERVIRDLNLMIELLK